MSDWKFYVSQDAKRSWEKIRPTCATTFHLPEYSNTFVPFAVDSKCFDVMPFERFCIAEPFLLTKEALAKSPDRQIHLKTRVNQMMDVDTRGLEEMVCWNQDGEYFGFLSKIRYTEGPAKLVNRVLYGPQSTPDAPIKESEYLNQLELYYRFWNLLNNRKVRFLESHVSRQYRRALGAPTEYREYIIITKEDQRYRGAMSQAGMMERMVALHAVRAHKRLNWRTGEKSITVRQHFRGAGELGQVKDYHFK
jgi:hypothetical protein